MDSKQWRLYNFLKFTAQVHPDKWVSHEEICEALPNDFKMNHIAVKKKCCSTIQKQVIDINSSDEIEKIIMHKNQTYKLAASQEEAFDFIKNKLLYKGCRILERYWQLHDKIFKDGQGKLLSVRGDVIDEESRARPYVEAFVKKTFSKAQNTVNE